MRRLDRFAGGVNGIGRLGDRGHDLGKRFAMSFDGGSFVRLGNGLGRNDGLGANSRGRLVGVMIVLVMIMLVVVTMVVIVRVRMIMVAAIIVLVIVMPVIVVIMVMMVVVVTLVVLAVMLGIGVQVLALMRRAFGVLLMGLALDRLGGGIATCVETLDNVAADALAVTAAARIAVA
ncbi:hypothetical protein [Bradyrhizobium sp. CCBAU 11434]|uniref:hypothetical protein n=1 Tax=Bradyrhizobium sp. CCBAU 11434 TaxID=1630885 RepID=UPI0023057A08|nr:hypothetical protein [Bradyrhizobium sp. CCBAU 11434]